MYLLLLGMNVKILGIFLRDYVYILLLPPFYFVSPVKIPVGTFNKVKMLIFVNISRLSTRYN